MAALTADKKSEFMEGEIIVLPVAASTKIFAGSFVCVNSGGFVVPGADTSGLVFAGVAREYADNSAGANGAVSVKVQRRGLVKSVTGTISAANIGNKVFLLDDQTAALAAGATNDIFCGVIARFIDSTHAWLDIEPAVQTGRGA